MHFMEFRTQYLEECSEYFALKITTHAFLQGQNKHVFTCMHVDAHILRICDCIIKIYEDMPIFARIAGHVCMEYIAGEGQNRTVPVS
jgi:hypothetical protein